MILALLALLASAPTSTTGTPPAYSINVFCSEYGKLYPSAPVIPASFTSVLLITPNGKVIPPYPQAGDVKIHIEQGQAGADVFHVAWMADENRIELHDQIAFTPERPSFFVRLGELCPNRADGNLTITRYTPYRTTEATPEPVRPLFHH